MYKAIINVFSRSPPGVFSCFVVRVKRPSPRAFLVMTGPINRRRVLRKPCVGVKTVIGNCVKSTASSTAAAAVQYGGKYVGTRVTVRYMTRNVPPASRNRREITRDRYERRRIRFVSFSVYVQWPRAPNDPFCFRRKTNPPRFPNTRVFSEDTNRVSNNKRDYRTHRVSVTSRTIAGQRSAGICRALIASSVRLRAP